MVPKSATRKMRPVLGHAPILGVEDAPGNLALWYFDQTGFCPLVRLRHWKAGLSDFFKHAQKVLSMIAGKGSGDILPDEVTGISAACGTPHGIE